MAIIKDTDYRKHKDHEVILESTAVIEQEAWWTPQGGINFGGRCEVVEYLTTQPYELRCSDCELVLTGFDLEDV